MKPTPSHILAKAAAIEAELRELASQAARAGDWDAVRAVSSAAEDLEPLTSRSNDQTAGDVKDMAGTSAAPATTHERKRSRRSVAGSSKKAFPRFAREGDELVKIGWSKSEGAEYRHRATRACVDQVVTAMERAASGSGRFTTDELLPVISPVDGSEVPAYQTYLVLRWLRDVDLVRQKGRSGYTFTRRPPLATHVDGAWASLPED